MMRTARVPDRVQAPSGRVPRIRFAVAFLACFALGLAVGADVAAGTAEQQSSPPPVELSIATLDHGTFDLAAHRGRWVVANYWATWCAPCRKEMPELDALHRERADVEVLGLAFEEIESADMRSFLADRPVSYPIAIVDVYSPPQAFEVPRGMPMTYLIDPKGRIAHRWLGPVTKAEIEGRIAAGAE